MKTESLETRMMKRIERRRGPVKGLRAIAAEALKRLGIKSMPTQLEKAYRAGETTQVPAGRAIGVNKRVRRKIGYNDIYVSFERDRPASR